MSIVFHFNDRRTYFNFVKGWKRDYNQVSSDIKVLNMTEKTLMRLNQPAAIYQRANRTFAEKATRLLAIRLASKIEAGRQRALNLANPDSNSQGATASELSGNNC
jgi:hypothetical protein